MPLRAELAAASSTTASSTTPGPSNTLKIRLADDSKATVEANAIMKGYAILVTDSAGLPVPDAVVAIRLPEDGPTGYFQNGERSAVAYSDASGIAKFPQVNWGGTTGPLSVRVTAVKGELHAGVLIEQTVVVHPPPNPLPAPLAPAPTFPAEITTPGPVASNPTTASIAPSGASPVGMSSNAPVNTSAAAKAGLPLRTSAVPAPAVLAPAVLAPAVLAPAVLAPGVPTSVATVHTAASPQGASGTGSIASTDPKPAEDTVSVVNTAGSQAGHGVNKKWVILAAVAAGAGLGAALALAGHSGATVGAAAPVVTIGTPIVSIGH